MREVVGVAIVHRGRVLAARRAAPPALAGLWELPGGKVEPDEDPDACAVREITEELGCEVAVTGWLGGSTVVPTEAGVGDLVLRVATAELVVGDPVPTEHDAVRWLGAAELDEVDWLEPDRPFLAELSALLSTLSR
jgi:8-oxo-dGTP diphosphatase